MTDSEAYDLGKRALSAGFQWRAGCVSVSTDERYNGSVCLGPSFFYPEMPAFASQARGAFSDEDLAPDVRDPGVIGHLWAQLAERVGTHIEIRRSSDGAGWSVGSQQYTDDTPGMQSRHLPRALVAALELAKR